MYKTKIENNPIILSIVTIYDPLIIGNGFHRPLYPLVLYAKHWIAILDHCFSVIEG